MHPRPEESKQPKTLMSVIESGSFAEIKAAIGKIGDVNEVVPSDKTILSAVIDRVDSDPRWIGIFKLLLQAGAKPHTGGEQYSPHKDFNAAHEIAELDFENVDTKNNLMKCLLANSQHTVDLNMRRYVCHEAILAKLCCSLSEERQQRNLPVIKTILEPRHQVNVNDRGTIGTLDSPLLHAASNGFIGAINLLLEKKADLEAEQHPYGFTPAMVAAKNKKYEALEVLLNKGAKTFNQFSSLLHIAIDDYGVCDFVLYEIAMKYKTPLNTRRGEDGDKPLLRSTSNPEMTLKLLRAGADATAIRTRRERHHGNFLHHAAIQMGASDLQKVIDALDDATLKILLEMQEHDGHSPLHYAIAGTLRPDPVRNNNINVLLQAHRRVGVSIDLKNKAGLPPLFMAVALYKYKALEILLQNGANIYETIASPLLSSSVSESKLEPKDNPKQITLSQYCIDRFSPSDAKEVFDLIGQELQSPSHPENQKRLKLAFVMGLHPKLGVDSAILKSTQERHFDRQVFGFVFDHYIFKRNEKNYLAIATFNLREKKESPTDPENFPVEKTAHQLLVSLGVKSEKIKYMRLNSSGELPSLYSEFAQEFKQKASTTKPYLLVDLPIADSHVAVVIHFQKKEIYYLDPFLNQKGAQTKANDLLRQAIGEFARLEAFELVTSPVGCANALATHDEASSKILSCVCLVGMILNAEEHQFRGLDGFAKKLYESMVIDARSGKGVNDKSGYFAFYQEIVALASDDLHLRLEQQEIASSQHEYKRAGKQ